MASELLNYLFGNIHIYRATTVGYPSNSSQILTEFSKIRPNTKFHSSRSCFIKIISRWCHLSSWVPLLKKTAQRDDAMKRRQSSVIIKTNRNKTMENVMGCGNGEHTAQKKLTTTTAAMCSWKSSVVTIYSLTLFPQHLFPFTFSRYANFSISSRRKNSFAIFRGFLLILQRVLTVFKLDGWKTESHLSTAISSPSSPPSASTYAPLAALCHQL